MDIQWWRITPEMKFIYGFEIFLVLWLVVWQSWKAIDWFRKPDGRKWNKLSWENGTKQLYLLMIVPVKALGWCIGVLVLLAIMATGQTYDLLGFTLWSEVVSKDLYNNCSQRRKEELVKEAKLKKEANAIVKNEKVKPKVRYGNRFRPK